MWWICDASTCWAQPSSPTWIEYKLTAFKPKLKSIEMNKTQFSFFLFFFSTATAAWVTTSITTWFRLITGTLVPLSETFSCVFTLRRCATLWRESCCAAQISPAFVIHYRSEGVLWRPSGSWYICSTCTLMISLVLFFSSCFLRRTPALEKWGEKSTSSTTSYIVLTPTMHLSICRAL